MPLLETKAAASAQGFGLTLGGAERVFIEDVMSVFLYTGNGSTQTITNGIDLLGKGGLVWTKRRNAAFSNELFDTARGNFGLESNNTGSQWSAGAGAFTTSATGYTWGIVDSALNANGGTYVSWTFRKQPKFCDVVTWTGDGTSDRVLNHALGSAPGAIFIKCTSNADDWWVTHRSVGTDTGDNSGLRLNTTDASSNYGIRASTNSSTTFTLKGLNNVTYANTSGRTYVAYLFAHDAGGFGLTGTDNVISCGSFTTDGSGNATVTLGYEPQWLLTKVVSTSDNWMLMDQMRGFTASNSYSRLIPNLSNAEGTGIPGYSVTSTGFTAAQGSGPFTYIYIAIRRGPMRVPTSGTSVFAPIARTGTNAAGSITTVGFPPDLSVSADRTAVGRNPSWTDRLRGSTKTLYSATTNAEFTSSSTEDLTSFARMNGVDVGTWNQSVINAPSDIANWFFRRAPGFFDMVCYTGVGAGTSFTHNLGVVPELIIVKLRSSPVSNTAGWFTYHTALGTSSNLLVNTNAASASTTAWNVISSTAVSFNGAVGPVSVNNDTYVAYLFATVAGVSKVGSYTGNGSSLTINCGFTGGARFVLIKRTDSTGNWLVWDSARGIVAGNDPYLALNNTNSEVTTDDSLDTASSGFVVNQDAATNINLNGGTYIYLAIA